MNKKAGFVIGILVLLLVVGYTYLKTNLLKAKDFEPATSKKANPIDLRPAIIAKLQQIVKDGSDGLYLLTIGKIDPNITAATLDATEVDLKVDSAGFRRLQQQRQLPDDVFNVHFSALHITGLGIDDLLHKKRIDLKTIDVKMPVIKAWHHKQPYNQVKRAAAGRLTLYQKLTKQVERIALGEFVIEHSQFEDYDVDHQKQTVLKDITLKIADVLVDSSTQHDPNRFFFARQASLQTKDYSLLTKDSLYELKIASLDINAAQHQVTAKGFSYKPRGSRQQFEQKIKTRQEMFSLWLPAITFEQVDWWDMLHRERFVAGSGRLDGGKIEIYLNKSLPKSGGMKVDNFPQQLLHQLGLPLSIKDISFNKLRLTYEEFNPDTKQSGMVTFDQLTGQALHVSNLPADIKQHPTAVFKGHTQFMGGSPMAGEFTFDLNKNAAGAFKASLKMGVLGNEAVNRFAVPLGQLRISSGTCTEASTELTGNNRRIQGNLTARYDDLHIVPLKKTANEEGKLKQKKPLRLVANLVIKNANPGKNEVLRQASFELERKQHGNFFNFLWSAIKMGLLKLIGIPGAFAS